MAISQVRLKEKKLNEECAQLKKLIAITKPRNLDSLFASKQPKVLLSTDKTKQMLNTPSNITIVESSRTILKNDAPFIPETEDDDDENEPNIKQNESDIKLVLFLFY